MAFVDLDLEPYLPFYQELLERSNATDASGNVVLADIGVYLQQKVIISFYQFFSLAYFLGLKMNTLIVIMVAPYATTLANFFPLKKMFT